jgi:hypothetical protein
MRDNPLTINETSMLVEALDILEEQFDEDQGASASVVDSDSDEYVDIQVDYADDTYDSMAVERSKLSDGSTAKEIASWIS